MGIQGVSEAHCIIKDASLEKAGKTLKLNDFHRKNREDDSREEKGNIQRRAQKNKRKTMKYGNKQKLKYTKENVIFN